MTAGRLGLLGLGLRAGQVVVGTSAVRDALRRGDLALVVMAQDHSTRTDEKVGRLARARDVALLAGPPADELGRLLGRDSVQVVGVKDSKLAAGIRGDEAQDLRRMD
jgi:ribosomal protein L7Ae-like RNA K-turn-binding protein